MAESEGRGFKVAPRFVRGHRVDGGRWCAFCHPVEARRSPPCWRPVAVTRRRSPRRWATGGGSRARATSAGPSPRWSRPTRTSGPRWPKAIASSRVLRQGRARRHPQQGQRQGSCGQLQRLLGSAAPQRAATCGRGWGVRVVADAHLGRTKSRSVASNSPKVSGALREVGIVLTTRSETGKVGDEGSTTVRVPGGGRYDHRRLVRVLDPRPHCANRHRPGVRDPLPEEVPAWAIPAPQQAAKHLAARFPAKKGGRHRPRGVPQHRGPHERSQPAAVNVVGGASIEPRRTCGLLARSPWYGCQIDPTAQLATRWSSSTPRPTNSLPPEGCKAVVATAEAAEHVGFSVSLGHADLAVLSVARARVRALGSWPP